MKLRAAVGAGVLLMCWLAITCTRQTPGSPSTNQTQANQSAENTPPKPTPAPTAAEENRPAAAAPQAAAPSQAQAPAAPGEANAPAAPEVAVEPTPKPPAPVVLPAGTVLMVRTSSEIGAKSAQAGQTFQAAIAQPVLSHGRTAIPAGSAVTGVIVQAKQGGKIKGASNLALQLTSLRVRGVSYPIHTGQFVQQQKGKGGRTAKMGVGGGAAGALIGGIAGGGKGAAIGALAGGGAGVAGSAVTGNKELTIPAESVLQFKLAQPLRMSAQTTPRAGDESNQ